MSHIHIISRDLLVHFKRNNQTGKKGKQPLLPALQIPNNNCAHELIYDGLSKLMFDCWIVTNNFRQCRCCIVFIDLEAKKSGTYYITSRISTITPEILNVSTHYFYYIWYIWFGNHATGYTTLPSMCYPCVSTCIEGQPKQIRWCINTPQL